MALSRNEFVEVLLQSGVVGEQELSAVEESFGGDSPSADMLIGELVKQEKLTPYQAQTFQEGEHESLVFGDYVVLDQIGQGGMGVVYKAMHRVMHRLVAVKRLPPHVMKSPSLVQRFYREVRAAAKLMHPNIVAAHDAGAVGDTHYLVMELVEGSDLSALVHREGKLTVSQSVNYMAQAARGLAYAHEQGIIHRDIKPGNILVSNKGEVKLLDMGLARVEQAIEGAQVEQTITVEGRLMGTVEYMAPEQAADAHSADHRADIYALGCTLYRIVTADLPFPGANAMQKLIAHRENDIPLMATKVPAVPNELDAIFQSMVAKKPEQRIQSMTLVADALDALVRDGVVPPWEQTITSLGAVDEGTVVSSASIDPDAPTTGGGIKGVGDSKPVTQIVDPDAETIVGKKVPTPNVDAKNVVAPPAAGHSEDKTLSEADAVRSPVPASNQGQKPAKPSKPAEPAEPNRVVTSDGNSINISDLPVAKPSKKKKTPAGKPAKSAKAPPVAPSPTPAPPVSSSSDPLASLAAEVSHAPEQPAASPPLAAKQPKQTKQSKEAKQAKQAKQARPSTKAKADKRPPSSQKATPASANAAKKKKLIAASVGSAAVLIAILIAVFGGGGNDPPPADPTKDQPTKDVALKDSSSKDDVTKDGSTKGKTDPGDKFVSLPAVPGANNALLFGATPGRKDRCSVLDLSIPAGDGNLTVEGFVKFNKVSGRRYIFGFPSEFMVQYHEGNGVVVTGQHAWGNLSLVSKHKPATNQRTHIAAVRDGNQVRLYIDGKHAGETVLKGELRDGRDTLDIGYGLAGVIDEVRVSKVARYNADFIPDDRHATDKDTLALYHFDEGTGDELKDSSGNNHHGKIVGAKWVKLDATHESETVIPAVPGADNALAFAGADTIVRVDSLKLDCTKAHTMEAWVWAEKIEGNIISWDKQKGKSTIYPRLILSQGKSKPGAIFEAAGYKGSKSNATPPAKRWIHLAGVHDASGIRIYVDGKEALQNNISLSLAGSQPSSVLIIGGAMPFHGELFGRVDEVRISQTARYTKDFTPDRRFKSDKETLALYHFDEGSGDVLQDSSGNGHHGKIVGAKWVRVGPPANYALKFKPVPEGTSREEHVSQVEVPSFKDTTPSLTMEVWIGGKHPNQRKREPAIQSNVNIMQTWMRFGIGSGSGRNYCFILGRDKSGNVLRIEARPQDMQAVGPIVHLAAVRDADNGEVRFYMNGKLIGSRPIDSVGREQNPLLIIGGGYNRFAGWVDEARVSRTARYDEEFTPERRFTPDKDTLALYHFDEGTGDVLKDSSGNNHHGKIVGAEWMRVVPPASYALQFKPVPEGVSKEDHVSQIEVPSFKDTTPSLTMEVWISGKRPNQRIIAGNANIMRNWAGYGIGSNGGGNYKFRFGTDKSGKLLTIDVSEQDMQAVGPVVHLAAVRDADKGETRFYMNGTLIGSGPNDNVVEIREPLLMIGGGFTPFAGWMDEARISSTARYDEKFTPERRFTPDKDTLVLYHFDEGSGDELKDSSGNNHHGKIVGAEWVQVGGPPKHVLPNGWVIEPPVNLGPVVNSKGRDGGPTISDDGRTLIFHSTRPGGQGSHDLWMSSRSAQDKPFGQPVNMGPVVNSGEDDSHPSLSTDALTLIFVRGGPGDSQDLWMSTRTSPDEPFGQPVSLQTVNSGKEETNPDLSDNGRTLVFCSKRNGGNRMWVSTRGASGEPFGRPEEFEVTFNLNAQGPAVSSDRQTLIFHSSGRGSHGKDDLFLATRAADGAPFDTPVNMGPLVNSAEFDTQACLSADGRSLFFESTRPGGHGGSDLWMARIRRPGDDTASTSGAVRTTNEPSKPRWPLAPTSRADIDWLHSISKELTLRTGPTTDINYERGKAIPAGPATVVGAVVQGQLTQAMVQRFVAMTDLESLDIRMPHGQKIANAATAADMMRLTRLQHLRSFALWKFETNTVPQAGFFEAFPKLERLQIKEPLTSDWAQRVARAKTVRHLMIVHCKSYVDIKPLSALPNLATAKFGGYTKTFDERVAIGKRLAKVAPSCRITILGSDDGIEDLVIEPTAPLPGSATDTSRTPPPAVAPFLEPEAKAHQKSWADHLGVPVEKEVTLPGGKKMTFMLIPPGEFKMGSTEQEQKNFLAVAKSLDDSWAADRIPHEGPQHAVRITKPFYLGKYEVTQAQWQSVMGNNPSVFKDGPSHPVEKLNWNGIQPFLVKLNQGASRGDSKFALPSEAQWEYACRAGTTEYWYGTDTDVELAKHGWFRSNSGSGPHEVGQLLPNAWGLHDMHGNVWEWCADRYAADAYAKSPLNDPTGPATGSTHVFRGGAWRHHAPRCRAALRHDVRPGVQNGVMGVRLALTIEAAKPKPATPPPAVAPFLEPEAKAHQKAWADYLGEPVVTTNSLGMKFAVIPPGKGQIERGHRAHMVELTKPFRMGIHEVTQGQWKAVMKAEPWKGVSDVREGDNYPAVYITQDQALAFCRKLTDLERQAGRLPANASYRLPTKVEWEIACRAGTTTGYSYGDAASKLSEFAWYDNNALNADEKYAHAVGRKKPNPWGLYDMHGNVWEFCSGVDSKDSDKDPVSEPNDKTIWRMMGGSWGSGSEMCSSWYNRSPEWNRGHTGIRVVLTIELPAGKVVPQR